MSNPSSTLREVEAAIDIVIEQLIDSQHGFQAIGDELKDETLKRHFLSESLHRASFRGDLETILHQEGVHDIKEHGSVTGTLLRTWGNLKSKLGGGDHALLETAEQGEDETISAYTDALKRELPHPIREILTKQIDHIQASHDAIKTARDKSR